MKKKKGFSYLVIHLMDLPALEPICLLSEVLGVWTVPFLPIVVKVYSGCETLFQFDYIMGQLRDPCDYLIDRAGLEPTAWQQVIMVAPQRQSVVFNMFR